MFKCVLVCGCVGVFGCVVVLRCGDCVVSADVEVGSFSVDLVIFFMCCCCFGNLLSCWVQQ